jgi:cytochrome P450
MDNPTKGTVIDQIAQNTSYKTDKERVSDILMLLFAGHDTTAYSLSWTLLELAKKPHEQRLLRNELRSNPEEDRSNLTMLRNVMKEGMRLQPVAAFQSRMINKDIIHKREGHSKGFLIPKGTQVTCSDFILCRNEKYFKDPDEFMPSRWEDASDDAIAAMTPFVLGSRNCVGQSLAMIEVHCVLSRLCTDYAFSVEEEGIPKCRVTNRPSGARLVAQKV